MLNENGANDHLSHHYGHVFKVMLVNEKENYVDVKNETTGSSFCWFPERLEKVYVVDPIDFDDVMSLL